MTADRVLSILGAVAGLTALFAQLWQFVLSGSRIRIFTFKGVNTRTQREVLSFDVQNRGRMPITIQSLAVELGWSDIHFQISQMNSTHFKGPELPLRIEALSVASWIVDLPVVREMAVEHKSGDTVRVFATLATGKGKRSKGFSILEDPLGGPVLRWPALMTLRFRRIVKRAWRKAHGWRVGQSKLSKNNGN